MLATASHRDVGCLSLGFVPTADKTAQVYTVILAVGAPIALWMRSGDEAAVEGALRRLIDASDPADLRDRVQNERANATGDAGAAGGVTLLWDDPNRPPYTVDR
jgi:hypothetical protein